MKRSFSLVLATVITILGMQAYAMPVSFENGSFETTAIRTSDESSCTVKTNSFQVLGTNAEGQYMIYADDQFLKLTDNSVLQPILTSMGGEVVLPSISDYQLLARGAKGDDVIHLQENLIKLGYLEGSADGNYGGQSQRAVSAFQQAMGMADTGTADALLQMLVDSMASDTVSYSADKTVGKTGNETSLFETIAAKSESNLAKAMELGMDISYDDIYGEGMITDGNVVTFATPAMSEIDRLLFEVSFGIRIKEEQSGVVKAVPVMNLKCTGVQRPAMQEVTLKSDSDRHTFGIDNWENTLSGLNAVEQAAVALDADTIAMLAKTAESGELKIRLVCKYNTYDIIVPQDKIQKIATMAEAMASL